MQAHVLTAPLFSRGICSRRDKKSNNLTITIKRKEAEQDRHTHPNTHLIFSRLFLIDLGMLF